MSTQNMILRRISREDLANEPHLAWNSFIDIVATEAFEDLSDIQRLAHLVFWYDAEVNNGGHLQYFLNSAGERASETLSGLLEIGLETQHSILREALEIVGSVSLSSIDTVEEYIAEAAEDKFGQLDHRYYAHQGEVDRFLEEYLEGHFDNFIELN